VSLAKMCETNAKISPVKIANTSTVNAVNARLRRAPESK